MNIHHFATVFSIIFSYLTNFEIYGVLVLFLSDISDCFLNIAKTMRDLKLWDGKYNDAIFAIMFSIWLYTRTLFLPICFFKSSSRYYTTMPVPYRGDGIKEELFQSASFGIWFTIFNVYSICVLNMYWTYLMLQLLYDKLFNGGKVGYHVSYEGDTADKNAKASKSAQKKENVHSNRVELAGNKRAAESKTAKKMK